MEYVVAWYQCYCNDILEGKTRKFAVFAKIAIFYAQALYESTTTLDIAKISLAVFYLNLRRLENKLFAVSLYELDRKLEQYKLLNEPANKVEID